ncbi:dienelactone hydrolase [Pestalotiopsis sp. NC0098]|nr:dienelactone hydrolase [Pestalotiopsis sp. NC0098]
MASHPPGDCCGQGFKHEGEPEGQFVKVASKWDGYLATPSHGTEHKDVSILYIPDILGLYNNAKLLADQFAVRGYRTLVVDVLNGDPAPLNFHSEPGFHLPTWVSEGTGGKNPHTKEAIDPIVSAALTWLREELGAKKIGAVGYCFGAKYVVRHLVSDIDAGFIAHPSFVDEDELAAITKPLSIAAAETDSIFPAELRHKSEEILIQSGVPYQLNLFSSVSHGFAVRCDLQQKDQRFAKEQALLQAVAWFDHHLL